MDKVRQYILANNQSLILDSFSVLFRLVPKTNID